MKTLAVVKKYSIWLFQQALIFSFFLVFPLNLSAQNPLLKNYTTNDGLPSYEVYMVLQDRQGYMWFATNYGVCRFDGYRFESFDTQDGLSDNTVYELFEDEKGRIWFITGNMRLSYWEHESIHEYKYNKNIEIAVPYCPFIENRSFFVDNNDEVYFSVYQGGAFKVSKNGKVSRIEPESLKNEKLALFPILGNKYMTSCVSIEMDSFSYSYNNVIKKERINIHNGYANRMNLLTSGGILILSQDNFIYEINEKGCVLHMIEDHVISVDEDNNGNIWVGLRNNGALCYSQGDLSKAPAFHILEGTPVTKILSDRENGLWFTTTTSGVFYTPSLNFCSYTKADGLLDNNVTNVSVDLYKM